MPKFSQEIETLKANTARRIGFDIDELAEVKRTTEEELENAQELARLKEAFNNNTSVEEIVLNSWRMKSLQSLIKNAVVFDLVLARISANKLRDVSFRGLEFSKEEVDRLALALQTCTGLESLEFSECRFNFHEDLTLSSIIDAIQNLPLQKLIIDDCSGLRSYKQSDNPNTGFNLFTLIEYTFKNKQHLDKLSVYFNPLSDEGFLALLELAKKSQLKTFSCIPIKKVYQYESTNGNAVFASETYITTEICAALYSALLERPGFIPEIYKDKLVYAVANHKHKEWLFANDPSQFPLQSLNSKAYFEGAKRFYYDFDNCGNEVVTFSLAAIEKMKADNPHSEVDSFINNVRDRAYSSRQSQNVKYLIIDLTTTSLPSYRACSRYSIRYNDYQRKEDFEDGTLSRQKHAELEQYCKSLTLIELLAFAIKSEDNPSQSNTGSKELIWTKLFEEKLTLSEDKQADNLLGGKLKCARN